jgi:hypothetical protein
MTTVYDYIATSDPIACKQLCESYGYTVTNPQVMSQNLKHLVNNEGENALKSLMDIHPDKDIILDFFGTKEEKKSECGCQKHNQRQNDFRMESYYNANGNAESSEAKSLASNTNTIIFASALFLAVAIIFKR